MPIPYLDAEGKAVVPALTAFVLEQFESDSRVFSGFCSGNHNLQLYAGDIASQHDHEAAVAEKFRTHPLRRIREWAEQEERSARSNARRWRERDEEFGD